jgi:hypothetical protein
MVYQRPALPLHAPSDGSVERRLVRRRRARYLLLQAVAATQLSYGLPAREKVKEHCDGREADQQ